MHPRSFLLRSGWLVVMLIAVLSFAACASGATAGAPTNGTAAPATATATAAHTTPAPTSTPAPPPPHAIAWSEYDAQHNLQLWASINDGPPKKIAQYPQNTQGCQITGYGPPMFSPDLQHIAVPLGGGCTDGTLTGQAMIVTVSNGQMSPVTLPNYDSVAINARSIAWIDNQTVVLVTYDASYTYTLGASAPVALPGITHATEGLVRGGTLFYQRGDSGTGGLYTTTIHRYDLASHSALPGTISQGSFRLPQGSPGDFHFEGWDVSPDGAHVAYQVTTPATAGGIASSAIYNANADGSGATKIAQYMSTNTMVRMRFSPNGQVIAFTSALPSPDVLSACPNSPGTKGDPCFHAYSPDGLAFPAWKWDSSAFIAATADIADAFTTQPNAALNLYTVGTANATLYVPGGYNPYSTP
jgi:hypothetical protein